MFSNSIATIHVSYRNIITMYNYIHEYLPNIGEMYDKHKYINERLHTSML